MRLSSMTPIALAALIAGGLPLSASANPTSNSLAVPVSPAPSAPSPSQGLAIPAATTPETQTMPEFSQRATVPTLSSNPNDLFVRVARVSLLGASEELQTIARQTIKTQEGGDTNQQQLQGDVATLLETGLFSNASVSSQANQNGLEVTFTLEPTIARSLRFNNTRVLTPEIANSFFSNQIGKPISPTAIKQGLTQIDRWYQDNGYVIARVVDAHPSRDGTIAITVAEGAIANVEIRFIDDKGQPTDGRTQQDYLRKGLKLKPGDIFQLDTAREDLRQLYQLGLFKTANIKLEDAPNQQVNVAYLLTESPSRGFDAGGGYSDSAGLFGSIRYNDQNFGGVNNQLNVNATVGTRDVQFNANYGKPYRASRPDELGYNINAFRGSGTSTALEDSTLANGDSPRERRIGAGVTRD